MGDAHQVNAIIATAILDYFKEYPGANCSIEEAKLLGKQVVEALNDAGLQITSVDAPRPSH